MIDSCKATFGTKRFSTSHFRGLTEIHSRTPTLSSTLFCDNFVKLTVIFVILFRGTVVYQKLIRQEFAHLKMLVIKKLTKQCAPCHSASIMKLLV